MKNKTYSLHLQIESIYNQRESISFIKDALRRYGPLISFGTRQNFKIKIKPISLNRIVD